jgi:lipid A 3-O-deacylase
MKRIELLVSACATVALAGAAPARADPEVQALAVATGVIALAEILGDRSMLQEPARIALGVGRFDPVKNVRQAAAFGVEYRDNGIVWWKLRSFAGAGLTSSRSLYGYGGVRFTAYWGQHFAVTPSFAIGGYSRGEGKDLGSPPVLGRFGLDFEYAFGNALRVGLAYHHMSNGKILGQSHNPGTEIVGLTISTPLR